eukprot:361930-Chlamydomonas_euryale.AAC.2
MSTTQARTAIWCVRMVVTWRGHKAQGEALHADALQIKARRCQAGRAASCMGKALHAAWAKRCMLHGQGAACCMGKALHAAWARHCMLHGQGTACCMGKALHAAWAQRCMIRC